MWPAAWPITRATLIRCSSNSARTYQPAKQSYYPHEHFTAADRLKRHPRDLLYYLVPTSYRPDRPSGLIIFLHGGGKTTSANVPENTLRSPSGEMLAATGMIAVGPSAPRRFLLSLVPPRSGPLPGERHPGGQEPFQHRSRPGISVGSFDGRLRRLPSCVARSPDRFAAVVVNSGSWSRGYWPVIRGTPLCIVQAIDDARPGVRWHYTDVQYGRWTDRILTRKGWTTSTWSTRGITASATVGRRSPSSSATTPICGAARIFATWRWPRRRDSGRRARTR